MPANKFYSDVTSISRLLEERSYFAIRPTFSRDSARARLPIALSLRRSERRMSYNPDTIKSNPLMAGSASYSYRAQVCEVSANHDGTYSVTMPVTERMHVPGAEEDLVLGDGIFIIGKNLDGLHLNLALTNLFAVAGYFESNSMSYRATKAMMEITGITKKIPAPIAQLFPARRTIAAHAVKSRHGLELRIQVA